MSSFYCPMNGELNGQACRADHLRGREGPADNGIHLGDFLLDGRAQRLSDIRRDEGA